MQREPEREREQQQQLQLGGSVDESGSVSESFSKSVCGSVDSS